MKLRPLAAATLLLLGFSGTAAAAPVLVTYELSSGVGFIGWGVGVPSASGVGGGEMTVVYSSGSSSIGGSLGSPATIQNLVVSFTSPGTLVGDPLSAIVIANGIVGGTIGGSWGFSGPTAVAASALGPSLPTFSQVGNAFVGFSVIGAATMGISGAGTQMFIGPGVTGSWTMGGLVGQEISRVLLPEPGAGVLLLAGLVGLLIGAPLLLRLARRAD